MEATFGQCRLTVVFRDNRISQSTWHDGWSNEPKWVVTGNAVQIPYMNGSYRLIPLDRIDSLLWQYEGEL